MGARRGEATKGDHIYDVKKRTKHDLGMREAVLANPNRSIDWKNSEAQHSGALSDLVWVNGLVLRLGS